MQNIFKTKKYIQVLHNINKHKHFLHHIKVKKFRNNKQTHNTVSIANIVTVKIKNQKVHSQTHKHTHTHTHTQSTTVL